MSDLSFNVGISHTELKVVFPLGRLELGPEILTINASILGNYIFHSTDIISIKHISSIAGKIHRIEIAHNVKNYPLKIHIYTVKDPIELIELITQQGFQFNEKVEKKVKSKEIFRIQQSGAAPLKKNFLYFSAILLTLLISWDIYSHFYILEMISVFGVGFFIAFCYPIITFFIAFVSGNFRSLILKKGRGLKDIDRFSIVLIIVFSAMLLTNYFMGNFYFQNFP